MHRKLLQLALLMLLSLPAMAQSSFAHFQWSCMTGNTPAITAGLPSVTLLQVSYPQCQVTVYQTGTMTPAVLYSNISGAPKGNPFTANTNGAFDFYVIVQNTPAVDVVMSGGLPAPGFPVPVTLSNIIFTAGGGGGGSPCGTVNDVQTNAGGGNFGCDSGFLYNTASNHTLFQNIFSAMLKVLVSDTTHSGLVTWGASNGTSITNTYSTGVNATLAATYGEAVPDAAPTTLGQSRVVSSLTPVNGLYPETWGFPVGTVYLAYLNPLDYTNGQYPTPCPGGNCIRTLFPQGVSLPFQGPPPSGVQSSNIVQFAPYLNGPACSIGSVGATTCTLPGPSIPGDILYIVGGAVTGVSTSATFTITDNNPCTDSYTTLDYVSGSLVGTLPSISAYTVIAGCAGLNAPITVTLTPTSSCGGTCIATAVQVFEINSGTLDVHGTGTSITGKTISCPSITTTHNPDVLLCSAFAYTNPAQTYAAGSATYAMVDTLTQAGASSNSLTLGTEAGNITTPAATVATMTASQSSLLTNFAVAFKTSSTSGSQTPTFRPRYYYDVASEQSWGFDVGAADAYLVGFAGCPATITSQPPTVVSFVPANANATTTPTLNYCNTGATTIKKRGSSGLVAVAANDMITSLLANLTYNGTYWVLGNPVAASGVGVTFDEIGSGTNTTATMTCGTGCSITVSGSGSNNANKFDGNSTIAIANGGTAATTAAAALINLFPAASEVGDLVYCATFATGACTSWALLAGNTSGTKYLQETSAGAPSWTTPNATNTWGFVFPGVPTASAYALRGATATCTIPANFTTPTTTASCGTNPTSNTVFTLKDGATTLGTVTLSSACAATLATSGGATKSVTVDDRLQFIAPASPDATAADIIIQLRCQ